MERFSAECAGSYVLVDIRHDVDLASAGELEAVLMTSARDRRPEPLIVDLSACCFIDCSGLAVLVRRYRRAANLTIVLPPGHPLHRIFTVTELDRVFTLVASRDIAIGRVQPAPPG